MLLFTLQKDTPQEDAPQEDVPLEDTPLEDTPLIGRVNMRRTKETNRQFVKQLNEL